MLTLRAVRLRETNRGRTTSPALCLHFRAGKVRHLLQTVPLAVDLQMTLNSAWRQHVPLLFSGQHIRAVMAMEQRQHRAQ